MGNLSSFLAVPTDVVDKHLCTASGIYLKVLLAILRANRVDTAQIAHKLSIPESDVVEAVGYWVQNGIFSQTDEPEKKKAPEPEKKSRMTVTSQSLTTAEITDRIHNNSDIRFLFSAVESLMGGLLNSTQQRTLIYIHESFGLPADVILMAVEYCFSIGKNNFHYIQQLCSGWAEEGICTHVLAEETIRRLTMQHSTEQEIIRMLGLGDRPLTPDQKKYLQRWNHQFGYGPDMIQIAYERTLNSINKLSLPYMNSILNSWNEKGIRTPADVAAKDSRPASRTVSGGQKSGWEPSYDLDELERSGLTVPKINGKERNQP